MMLIEIFFLFVQKEELHNLRVGKKTTNDREIRSVLKLSSGNFSLSFV